MSLQEFDASIDRMSLALEYSENLGQYVDASRILFQMNEQLPDDLQVILGDLEDPNIAKKFVSAHKSEIKHAILEHRQCLAMNQEEE